MARFLWICLGGAIGTGARYLLSGWLARTHPAFPWGTLAVNLIGSFLIAVILQASFTTESISPTLRLFLTTGIMGGFTTYSTFNYETLNAFQEGNNWAGVLNLSATVIGCLAAGILGLWSGRLLAGR
jgi:CrcB protein